MRGKRGPVEALFWEKVDRRSRGECWPWLASVRGGRVKHGQFWVPAGELGIEKSQMLQAHNVAFRILQGQWPQFQGLHGCDNPLCCNALNPEHVHDGTQQQNVREMFERGRARPHGMTPLPAARRRQLYAEFEQSGLSRPAFAELHGLRLTTLGPLIYDGRRGRFTD